MTRNALALICTAVCAAFASPDVGAEGRCPPGQYPVGGAGALGCAPIPGYRSGGSSQGERDAGSIKRVRLPGQWKITWGAIAWSPFNGISGVALDRYLSKSEAESAALQRCASLGGDSCEVSFTFYDQCAAAARNGEAVAFSGALQVELAKANAISGCEETSAKAGLGGTCEVTWTGCAKRAYVRGFR